jgi:hypothetical protein
VNTPATLVLAVVGYLFVVLIVVALCRAAGVKRPDRDREDYGPPRIGGAS